MFDAWESEGDRPFLEKGCIRHGIIKVPDLVMFREKLRRTNNELFQRKIHVIMSTNVYDCEVHVNARLHVCILKPFETLPLVNYTAIHV